MVAGLMWHWVFPINKNLWTSSYVVFTAGMACAVLATIAWLVEVKGWRGWSKPFVSFGLNPMIAFLGSGAMARLIGSLLTVPNGALRIPLQQAIYEAAFGSWLPPRLASLAFALALVAFW